MSIRTWRASSPILWVVALVASLIYAANAEPAWHLVLVLAMGVMSAMLMLVFSKRPATVLSPLGRTVEAGHP